MVVIRLSRGGTNKRPFYKIMVADKRAARDGSSVEQLGYFNPIASGREKRLEIDMERVNYWLAKGAQPSDRVQGLLREQAKPELLEKRKTKNLVRKERKKVEKAKSKVQDAPEAADPAKKESAETK